MRRSRLHVSLAIGVVLAVATPALAAWNVGSTSASANAKANALNAPGAGSTSVPTSTSLVVTWGAASGGATPSGYQVLRGTTSGSEAAVASGTCSGTISALSCTDSGLTAGTQYFYTVKARTGNLWIGPADSEFSGTTISSPAVTSPSSGSKATVAKGATANVTVTGTGFLTGITAIITTSNGFILNSVTFNSSTQVTLNVTAPSGNNKVDSFRLTNTDGGTVTCNNCLTT